MTPVYKKQAEQYAVEGYALFEGVLESTVLEMLRDQCRSCIAREDARADELDIDASGLIRRGQSYFAAQCQRAQPALRQLLFSPVLAELCRATLGFDAYFFLDQFVVTGSDGLLPSAWHQESGYVVATGGPPDHLPYVNFWCPLDDTTAENGALRLIPFSAQPKSRSLVPHNRDPQTQNLVADVDESKAITIEVAAGSVLALSSRVLHLPGPNSSPDVHRVYVAQYTAEVMVNPGTRHLRNNAIPLLRGGQHVTHS